MSDGADAGRGEAEAWEARRLYRGRAGTRSQRIEQKGLGAFGVLCLRKVARPLQFRGHGGQPGLCLHLAVALPTHQEEGAVPALVKARYPYRPAKHASELVAPQRRIDWGKEVARIEVVVAHEFEQHAMKIVPSGFEYRIHDSAGKPSLLRRISRGLHLEFLNGVEIGAGLWAAAARVPVLESINDKIGLIGARSTDVEAGTVAALRRGLHGLNRVGEIGKTAPVQRHLGDLLRHHDVSLGGVLRIQQRHTGLNVNRLLHRAHFQLQVEARRLIHLQFDPGLAQTAEPGLFYMEFISVRR